MDKLVFQLNNDFPQLIFKSSNGFCWSPIHKTIMYNPKNSSLKGSWALLHEVGHGLLNHVSYSTDFELLHLEVAAWDKALDLQTKYKQKIDPEHIQNCLDTYREWLHRRSTCPVCGNNCLQQTINKYQCFNCHTSWKVTASRFCRPYRRLWLGQIEKSPMISSQATFL